jgi:protein-tyrosine phosphatase
MGALAKRRIYLIVAAALAYVGGIALWGHVCRLPKRFAPVVEGRLYRSGEVTPGHLQRLQREYGVGRVISLLSAEAPVTVAERHTAETLGIEWHNVPLPGDGASTPADRQRILALLDEPNAPPTLVHCAAGVNRTGLAVGLYRLHCQHWTLAQVRAELRASGFEDRPEHENLLDALSAEAEEQTGTGSAPRTTSSPARLSCGGCPGFLPAQ